MIFLRPLLVLLFTTTVSAATLPGFGVETLARTQGFVSSVASDSHGTIYFTTTDGWIHRVEGTQATRVVSLPTRAGGNGGLLGMALLDDRTAVVHYTTWDDTVGGQEQVLDDVVSRVDLLTGAESVMHTFVCDIHQRSNGASSEHHGGNLTVAADGSVFVGIGEYGGRTIAQKPEWNAGKIWRIEPDGTATQWALGMRNPYDLAWDPELGRIVVADNGADGGDEIHIVEEGDNCGWPETYGSHPPMPGAVAPVYVFPETVAPTGVLRLDGTNPLLRRGYLIGAFVTSAIYYFPSMAGPIPAPVAVVSDFEEYIIDVTQTPNGDIIFGTAGMAGTAIRRLRVPLRGDCNGDGATDYRDVLPLMREINDGPPPQRHPMVEAQGGSYAGSWGCDANADGLIDRADLDALSSLLGGRRRAVRVP
ncbi:MAG TPA: PQQ-dependent sugar dehydrogenase [Thermoanaerobaculia bacterium]|nr:PQQ-dependent sugar dehydrogenase [Thermoanaerobaculia bacterium]